MSETALSERVEALLHSRYGVTLRDRQRRAVARAIARRGAATCAKDAEAYVQLLSDVPGEGEQLLRECLVGVTSLFRDRDVWTGLGDAVVPALLRRFPGTLRALCVGVATGEEAWTLALVLQRLVVDGAQRDYAITATDVDPHRLRVARRGVYRIGAEDTVADPLRPTVSDSGVRTRGDRLEFGPPLSEHVTFEQHDLLGPTLVPASAVLASFPLVLLRNVLIYLDPPGRDHALARLARVLPEGGALVLGEAEHVPAALQSQLIPWRGLPPRSAIFMRVPASHR